MTFVFAIATFFATILGGIFALKFKDRLHLVLGFSAGSLLGVAFFNLIPESLELASSYYSIEFISLIIAVGYFFYFIIDRFILLHAHSSKNNEHDSQNASERGILGVLSLTLHSILDGLAIGIAFQISFSIGLIIAIAVLIHHFSDGLNAVSLILKNAGKEKQARFWLFIVAIAPIFGASISLFLTLHETTLGLLIAIFAGSFLYIGASDLIPESHHAHPKILTTIMTLLGAGVIYVAIQLAH